MSAMSPTLEGFRAALRRPSLTFAEIGWCWTVGAVAWALLVFSFIQYLDTLPVTPADATLLGTQQPLLVGKAISHIFRGSLNRAAFTLLVAALAVAVLWIVAASLGRAATVRALLDHFRRDGAGDSTPISSSLPLPALRCLLALNFLRVALTLAAILAFIAAAVMASFTSPGTSPQPTLAFMLFLPFAALICIVWQTLNWLLSLAAIFAVRDGDDPSSALTAAVAFSRDYAGPVFAVSTWTGLAHLVAIGVAGTAISLPLAFLQFVPARLITAAVVLVILAYFAIVDWLYIARLGGYICITEIPEAVATHAPSLLPPSAGQPSPPQTAIDRDEPILSDLPNLAPET
jgi:hypothetical protein